MKRSVVLLIALLTVTLAAQSREVPRFKVDPSWPTVPSKWVLGEVSSVSIDAQDHVWVLQRPGTL